jgi:hypothetical protein
VFVAVDSVLDQMPIMTPGAVTLPAQFRVLSRTWSADPYVLSEARATWSHDLWDFNSYRPSFAAIGTRAGSFVGGAIEEAVSTAGDNGYTHYPALLELATTRELEVGLARRTAQLLACRR